MQFVRKSRVVSAALGVTGLGAAAVALTAAFPTIAQGAVVAVTSVSCSVTGSNWCISGNDSSSGIGVIGTSKSGTGLRGTSNSQYGLKATSGSGTAILAQTTSGASVITATGSSNGDGVDATAGDDAIYGKATGKSGVGVYGTSATGTGVQAYSQTGQGGSFYSGDGYPVYANGGKFGLYGTTPTDAYPLVLANSENTQDVVFQVDGNGNVAYKGQLQSLARTAGGGTARSFDTSSTQPSVEDTGTAQLVRGAAVVRFDPTFAASIEPSSYRVFVTPNGDTNGLFVVGKTAAGFIVRESHAGRSTVTFDYRIVATKFGALGQHMTSLSAADARTLGMHAHLPVLPARLPAAPRTAATP